MIRIALDAMGGDDGLTTTLPGVIYFLEKYKHDDIKFIIFGNKKEISACLSEHVIKNISINDTGDKVISNNENPIHAIKNCKGTSMYEAINCVAGDNADAVVSSGNTGAYMVLSKIVIGTIEGVLRPALIHEIPTKSGKTVMLDLGANTDCTADKLYQFAEMGKAAAKILLNKTNPSIGLLNIGTEKIKGTELLLRTYDLISEDNSLNFKGFVEGNNITDGSVDVIVTDGFSGNVALKAIEGTVKLITGFLKDGITSSILAKIAYFIGFKKVFNSLKARFNPALYNGAPFVGLNKVVIKSHGGCDYVGFARAINTAAELVRNGFIANIRKSLEGSNTGE